MSSITRSTPARLPWTDAPSRDKLRIGLKSCVRKAKKASSPPRVRSPRPMSNVPSQTTASPPRSSRESIAGR